MATEPVLSSEQHPLPRHVSTIQELREVIATWRAARNRIGLVPTMGALHEGHLSLVRASRQETDRTAVTIFVNPTQFGPREDFAKYPRTLKADLERLSQEQVDLVFMPSSNEMYPEGCSTFVEPAGVAAPWEGVCRPGHFRGVATVVLKLFQLIPATVAFFGEKDFQQCRVIERMVADLNVPIEIRRCPIIRESDGLAMSSRNRYLTSEEREQALAISRCLQAGRRLINGGERRAAVIRDAMHAILTNAGITSIDYIAVADPDTLIELSELDKQVVLLVAARVGSTRLIDNCIIAPPITS
jgi:pantoate--beta-alanine ligase